jgi:hypothetical protein
MCITFILYFNFLSIYTIPSFLKDNLHPKYFCFLILNVVAFPIKGVHWARDGPKFACVVDGGDASYIAKYNLVRQL